MGQFAQCIPVKFLHYVFSALTIREKTFKFESINAVDTQRNLYKSIINTASFDIKALLHKGNSKAK